VTVLKFASKEGQKHEMVNHKAGECARYENGVCITTSGIEGYFGLLKAESMAFITPSAAPFARYLSEFDFSYSQ
jgi:hypothetical protein